MPSFTDRELDVMAVLWELGSATVPEVREKMADDLAYTTVQTVLRTLEAKGYVSHHEEGRFHRYQPLVEREEAGRSALSRLLAKIFRGSPELLLTQLVAQRQLGDDQILRMRQLLEGLQSEDKES
ncbi:MAG TPA: BlaI/MecI/CopY family transcriptional regulator [Longimicrobium sp.]|nr:BlaI/MecI/CopY family transcriptional regulator [Longimicrobium sp.]